LAAIVSEPHRIAITPLPTNSQNPYAGNNLAFGALNNATVPTVTFRLDHTFNSSNSAYLRFTDIQQSTMANYSGFVPSIAGASLPAGISNTAGVHYPIYTAALGFTHIFSPTFVSQTVLGDTWQTNWTNAPQNGNGTNFESQWGLPNNFSSTNMLAFTGMMLQQYGSQRLWGGGEILPSVKEDLTKTIGKHQIYFDGFYTHLTVNTLSDRQSDNIDFGRLATKLYDPTTGTSYGRTSYTGLPDADLFLGEQTEVRLSKQ
jgi:hypothetical protein